MRKDNEIKDPKLEQHKLYVEKLIKRKAFPFQDFYEFFPKKVLPKYYKHEKWQKPKIITKWISDRSGLRSFEEIELIPPYVNPKAPWPVYIWKIYEFSNCFDPVGSLERLAHIRKTNNSSFNLTYICCFHTEKNQKRYPVDLRCPRCLQAHKKKKNHSLVSTPRQSGQGITGFADGKITQSTGPNRGVLHRWTKAHKSS